MSIARRSLFAVALAPLLLFFIGGCGGGGARYVMQDQYGGVVAIPANNNSWPNHYRDEAAKLMKQKCPQGYDIVQEGEVGWALSRREHRAQTEYQITFRSKTAPPVGPPINVVVPTAGRVLVPPPGSVGPPVMPPSGAVPIPTRVVVPPSSGLPPAPIPVGSP